jgi:predicted Rossmann-fold nucleotide-binding protein
MKTTNLNTLITTLERILKGEKIQTTKANAWVRELLLAIYKQGNLTHHPASIFYTDPAKIPHNNTRYFAAPSKELRERHEILQNPHTAPYMHVFSGAAHAILGEDFYTSQENYGQQVMVVPENISVQGVLEFARYLSKKNEGEFVDAPIIAHPSPVLALLEQNLFENDASDKEKLRFEKIQQITILEQRIEDSANPDKQQPLEHHNPALESPVNGFFMVNTTSLTKYLNARGLTHAVHGEKTRVLQAPNLAEYITDKEHETSVEGNAVAKHAYCVDAINNMSDAELKAYFAYQYNITVEDLEALYGFQRHKIAIISDDSFECLDKHTIRDLIEADNTGTFLRAYQQLEKEKGAKGDPHLQSTWWDEANFMEVDMSPFIEACGGLKKFITTLKAALKNLGHPEDENFVPIRSYSVIAMTRLATENTPTEDLHTTLSNACVDAQLILKPNAIKDTTRIVDLQCLLGSSHTFADMGYADAGLPRNIALHYLLATQGLSEEDAPVLKGDNSHLKIAVLNTVGGDTQKAHAKICDTLREQGYEPHLITDIDITAANDLDARVLSQHAGFVIVNDGDSQTSHAYCDYLVSAILDAKIVNPRDQRKPVFLIDIDPAIYDSRYRLGFAKIAPNYVYKVVTSEGLPAAVTKYLKGIEGTMHTGEPFDTKEIKSFEKHQLDPDTPDRDAVAILGSAGTNQPEIRILTEVLTTLCCSENQETYYNLVTGIGTGGVMGEAANTYAAVNSNPLGNIGYSIERLIITESNGVPNPHIGQATIVPTIHERQLQIFGNSDTMFYLAGGIGTVEELSLDLLLKERGSLFTAGKPSIVIDINGQYWSKCKDLAGITYINLDVPTFERLLDTAKAENPQQDLEEHNAIASAQLKIIIKNLLLPLVRTLDIL